MARKVKGLIFTEEWIAGHWNRLVTLDKHISRPLGRVTVIDKLLVGMLDDILEIYEVRARAQRKMIKY